MAEARTVERELMVEHRAYAAPAHDPSLEESIAFTAATMLKLMTEFGSRPGGSDSEG
ncbi:hypothetical protein D3C86_2097980 [compost metagenome]